MSEFVFEQQGIFSFTATKGDRATPLVPDSLVSARLYASAPSAAQVADTDNTSPGDAIESVTSWDNGISEGERLITFAAITDPDSTSTIKYVRYYIVVSYRLTSSGTIINDTESIPVWRPEAITSRFGIEHEQLFDLEEKLDDVYSENELRNKISLAEKFVKIDLLGRNFDIQRLRQEDAQILVLSQAAALACYDRENEPDDVWSAKGDRHMARYEKHLVTMPLGYDTDDDDYIEPGAEDMKVMGGGIAHFAR